MRKRDDDLSMEVESLRRKLEELEELSKGRGLAGVFKLKKTNPEAGLSAKPA